MRRFLITVCLIASALLGLTVWGCCGLTEHAIVAIDHWGDAGSGLKETAAKLNDPQKGTIKILNEDADSAKEVITRFGLVARHEQHQLTTWDDRGTELFNNADGAITDLRGTIRSAGKTADAATGALNAAQGAITAAKPVLDDTDATIKKIQAMTPDIARAAKGTADTAQETAGTMGDVHKVADHVEQAIDNPAKRPWYIKILPKTMQAAVQALLERWAVH